MALDKIAECILRELGSGNKSASSLAATCCNEGMRLVSPRLIWLEGLGMVENIGSGVFRITPLGQRFVKAFSDSDESSLLTASERPLDLDESEIELGK